MNNGLDMKQFDGKNALVTGGAGAIGSQLVRELVSAGASVTVLDDFSSGRMENLRDLTGMVTVIRGSVSSAEPLRAAFSKSPHYVFHLAAHFANQNSVEHPYADMMTNCVGTQMVLDEARKVPNLEGLVYASSSCVVAGQTGKTHEDMRPLPETPYGASKLAGENYTLVYAQVYKLPAAVVRYFNVFGPGEYPGRYRNVLPNFLHRAMHGEDLIITGTGEESREFVFVKDAVQGTLRAAVTPDARGDVFHLGSGNVIAIRELAESVLKLEGGPSRIRYAPRRGWDHVLRRETSFDKAVRVLGYQPATKFFDGLQATWQWLHEQEDLHGCVAPVAPVRSVSQAAAASSMVAFG